MAVALPCPKCKGAVVGTRHVDRDSCGSKPYEVIRLNPTGKESFDDIIDNAVGLMMKRLKP